MKFHCCLHFFISLHQPIALFVSACLPEFHKSSLEMFVSCLHQNLYPVTTLVNKNRHAQRKADVCQPPLPISHTGPLIFQERGLTLYLHMTNSTPWATCRYVVMCPQSNGMKLHRISSIKPLARLRLITQKPHRKCPQSNKQCCYMYLFIIV